MNVTEDPSQGMQRGSPYQFLIIQLELALLFICFDEHGEGVMPIVSRFRLRLYLGLSFGNLGLHEVHHLLMCFLRFFEPREVELDHKVQRTRC